MVPSGRSLSPQNCGVRRHISSIENKIQHGGKHEENVVKSFNTFYLRSK